MTSTSSPFFGNQCWYQPRISTEDNFPWSNILTRYQIFISADIVLFQGCRLWVHPRVYCFWSPLNWIMSWLAYWSTKCWDYLCCWWTQLQSVGGKNNRQQTRWCRKPVSFWRYWFLSALLVQNLLIILHIELSNFLWLLIIFGDCPNGKFPVWDRLKRNHQMVVTCTFIKGNIQFEMNNMTTMIYNRCITYVLRELSTKNLIEIEKSVQNCL